LGFHPQAQIAFALILINQKRRRSGLRHVNCKRGV